MKVELHNVALNPFNSVIKIPQQYNNKMNL